MSTSGEVSESIEMYLVSIATLQAEEQPVPISLLAEQLSHSPVSINEMCRKLVERGWASYQPYKGVTLTVEGETLAEKVLCRRRLWEVFLVEHLGAEPQEAEAFACQLEHATEDDLAERLAAFLTYPTYSPQRKPIPSLFGAGEERPARSLATLATGQCGQVINVVADEAVKEFLNGHGVCPGITLKVLAVAADGSLLLEISGRHLSLSRPVALSVDVAPLTETAPFDAGPNPRPNGGSALSSSRDPDASEANGGGDCS